MNTENTHWDGPRFGPRGRRGRRPFPPAGPPVPPFAGPVDDEDVERGAHRHRGRRHPFGPGFGPGFGPPFGPGMRGFPGPRGRRGRRTSRGDIRAAVLALVAEKPRHGYEIIQEIAERSGGAWRPSPGSVYPTLSQLEDEGLVRVEQTEGRRVVHLTEEGTRYVEEHRDELDAVWASVGREAEDEGAGELWEQLGQLHAAAAQVMAAGTPEQVATATTTITEARKAIYRLLAE
ncbi:PadR family transcriptional regulator [Pseudonocardia kunmingensis]|uniref:PadR family transcriptional regulator n=1 Tax=Pseudonocardia kunmingensis TaxID=630975 RepID=A0A543DN36_9PSEU|nr:PadR family transcriptional regulator [Pseudonocardia kunmingensis]TQM10756.1 PadR family transcriptional regulator [Pseudonocardia kunmingensis]